MFFEQMKREQKSVEGRIARLEEKLKEMPDGKLICAKNGKGYKWYKLLNGKCEYIPKGNKALAEALAKKRELITILDEAKSEKKAIERFNQIYICGMAAVERDYLNNEEICRLLNRTDSGNAEEWQSEPYERKLKHSEHLIHKSSWGEVFRSKSEMMIASCLRERGIQYRYECALKLSCGTFYPDFTIKHPKNGRIYYYEHFGKMDDPKYVNDNIPKLLAYTLNGIVPGVDLIMSFETQKEPLGMYTIDCLLTQYFS